MHSSFVAVLQVWEKKEIKKKTKRKNEFFYKLLSWNDFFKPGSRIPLYL